MATCSTIGGSRKALHLARLIATVALAGSWLASCGDSSDPGAAETKAKTSSEAATTNTKETADDGPGKFNVGARRDRDRLLGLFTGMQRDFQAGRMGAVCRHVSSDFLSQFPPGDESWEGSCATRLARYAATLAKAEPRQSLEIVWVRIYDTLDIGGITVKDPDGERIRIPFTRPDDRWELELGVFDRPEVLNEKLALGS